LLFILINHLFYSRWSIKARVTNKSEIRHWNNARGEGKLFSVDLIDESVIFFSIINYNNFN